MKAFSLLLTLITTLLVAAPVSAQYCSGGDPNTGINTAIGCLPLDKQALTNLLLNWAVGLAGGIGFILIIVSAILIVTARGDPKHVQAGRDLLTASIMGVVFIALSVVLLNFLGVNILGLGGLGFQL